MSKKLTRTPVTVAAIAGLAASFAVAPQVVAEETDTTPVVQPQDQNTPETGAENPGEGETENPGQDGEGQDGDQSDNEDKGQDGEGQDGDQSDNEDKDQDGDQDGNEDKDQSGNEDQKPGEDDSNKKPNGSSDKDQKLSPAAIGGIVVGIVGLLGLIGGGLALTGIANGFLPAAPAFFAPIVDWFTVTFPWLANLPKFF